MMQRKNNRFDLLTMGMGSLFFLLFNFNVSEAIAAPAVSKSATEPVAVVTKVPSDPEKLATLLKTYFTYERENRADPFTPFIKKQKKQAKLQGSAAEPIEEEILTGMQLFEPGQLKLVSIVFADNRTLAMVQDSVGKGYIVEKGTKIGRRGIIEEIMPNVVMIKQWSLTFGGQKRYKNIEMVLRKEGD
jgi:Tfp pilus assembly protein PilP